MAEFQTTESAEKVIDKYDLLESIALLFDELEATRRDRDGYAALIEGRTQSMSDLERYVFEVGSRRVFEDCTNHWYAHVTATEKDGVITYTPFEEWRSDFTRTGDFPSQFSKQAFWNAFRDELEGEYAKAKEKALQLLKEAENE